MLPLGPGELTAAGAMAVIAGNVAPAMMTVAVAGALEVERVEDVVEIGVAAVFGSRCSIP